MLHIVKVYDIVMPLFLFIDPHEVLYEAAQCMKLSLCDLKVFV